MSWQSLCEGAPCHLRLLLAGVAALLPVCRRPVAVPCVPGADQPDDLRGVIQRPSAILERPARAPPAFQHVCGRESEAVLHA